MLRRPQWAFDARVRGPPSERLPVREVDRSGPHPHEDLVRSRFGHRNIDEAQHLGRAVPVVPHGPHDPAVRHRASLRSEWEQHRYVTRDLDALEGGTSG